MERLAIIGAVAAGLAATGVLLNASNRLADRSGPAPQQTVGHPATATQDAPTGAATGATPEQRQAAPEAASGRQQKQAVLASRHMVVAAHPDAAAAGREILRQGGSAVDAAIATQLVLNLVEPQSSGIGGGAFMLLWDAKAERLTTIDARETAPAAAKPDRFLPADGSAPQWETTVHSGLSIGVPGLVRGLYLAHRRHGRLAWDALFAPAIKLAEDGFTVGPRLNLLLAGMGADAFGPTARALYFSPDGTPVAVGTRLRNPAFAQTLRAIASGGPEAFYTGPLAADLIARVRSAPNAPSDLTLEDLAGYRALVREPVCSLYRAYRVCGMGPPSSGALTIAQVLTLIEPLTRPGDPLAPAGVHAMAEAQKLAFADRGRFIADVDFVAVPAGLLDRGYLAHRRRAIDMDRAMTRAEPGEPPSRAPYEFAPDTSRERSGTSHISIVDDAGNAVSMTTTIESAFGARLMVGGFLLNNELTDFAWKPADDQGRLAANRVAPGKRPRSSMAPTMIFAPDGRLWALTGSPGGSRIINYTAKTIVAMIDWGLDPQAAADLVNFGSRNGPLEIEDSAAGRRLAAALAGRGHTINFADMTSGVHVIRVTEDGLIGGADPRREGVALGD